jgi:hypothetical protein
MSGNKAPPAPNYSNFGQANSASSSAISGLQSFANQSNPLVSNVLNNPYAAGYTGAGVSSGNAYGSAAGAATGAGASMYGAGNTALSDANTIFNMGLDPQQALYNQTLNNTTQQTQAAEAAQGVGNTPYGAGVTGQTISNFNMDWQNQQLARATEGAQAAAGLQSQASSDYQQGSYLNNMGAADTLQSGQVPYSTYNDIQNSGLSALLSGQNTYSNVGSAANAYLGLANQGYQNQLQAYQDQNQADEAFWSGLGSLGSGLSGMLGLNNGGLGSLLSLGM